MTLHIETWISTDEQQEVHHFIKNNTENGKTYIFGINPKYIKPKAYKQIRAIVNKSLHGRKTY